MGRGGTDDDPIAEIVRRSRERAEQARLQREVEAEAAARRAAKVQAGLTVINPGPIPYRDLEVAGDYDLERQIDARWGLRPDRLSFRLVEIDPKLLAEHAPPGGLDYYLKLAAEEEAGEDGEDEEQEWEEDGGLFHDGRRRYEIARGYRDAYARGEQVTPLVIDLTGEIILLDGYHRLAGALDAQVPAVRAYELLFEDE